MALSSHAAQEKLAALETAAAPFDEQLVQAAIFIGVDLNQICQVANHNKLAIKSSTSIYHGREEWLLRWLLKKLQSHKDDIARRTASSWWLLHHILGSIPLVKSAQILSERKFMAILQSTLEEQVKISSANSVSDLKTNLKIDSSSTTREISSRKSKKRKRSGDPITAGTVSDEHTLPKLLPAIFATVNLIVESTRTFDTQDDGRGAAFSAECMRSVTRLSAVEACNILGAWLFLCLIEKEQISEVSPNNSSPLSPFIDILETRVMDTEDLILFSLNCSEPLLSLLRFLRSPASSSVPNQTNSDLQSELSRLVASYIIIPARTAKSEHADSSLLSTLTRASILQNANNAMLFLDIAIRSLKSHGSKRRRPEEESWLQTVFTALEEPLIPQDFVIHSQVMRDLLNIAAANKIRLDLSFLGLITSKYSLYESKTDWSLLAAIIRLDANVFLIPATENKLLDDVLGRITKCSIDPTWSEISGNVVSQVLVPLLTEFAKARDLASFIRHWYIQLVAMEDPSAADTTPQVQFCAWEAEALQLELPILMEAYLTPQQVVKTLEWLDSEASDHGDSVSVLLDAITGSISSEDFVDILESQVYSTMGKLQALSAPYRWRYWRILSKTMQFATSQNLSKISALWDEGSKKLRSKASKKPAKRDSLLTVFGKRTIAIEALEYFRFLSAFWVIAVKEWEITGFLEGAIKELNSYLSLLGEDVQRVLKITSSAHLGDKNCDTTENVPNAGYGWTVWSFVRCILVEYPEILEFSGLGSNHTDSGKKSDVWSDIIRNVVFISAISPSENHEDLHPWLSFNQEAFSDLWISALHNEAIIGDAKLTGNIISLLLSSDTLMSLHSTPVTIPEYSRFVARSLLQLPLEAFSRQSRRLVLESWLQLPVDGKASGSAVDPIILSLKIKIMQHPTTFEGMNFSNIVELFDTLKFIKDESRVVSLDLLKEFTRLVLRHVVTNLEQDRNEAYVAEALDLCHSMIKKQGKDATIKEKLLDFGTIALYEVVFNVLDTKTEQLDGLSTRSHTKLTSKFKDLLVEKLQHSRQSDLTQHWDYLSLRCTIDFLTAMKSGNIKLDSLAEAEGKLMISSLKETGIDANLDITLRLETLIAMYGKNSGAAEDALLRDADSFSVLGRQSILQKAHALTSRLDNPEKLVFLESLLETLLGGTEAIASLLTVREVILSCESVRAFVDQDEGEKKFDLTSAYTLLSSYLWKASEASQFCIISETMEMMLRTKSQVITHWCIDNTLASISAMCSPNGPRLKPSHAGNIYLHLCQLMQAVLTTHRLKLEGHMHMVVQVMQALLSCLFVPLRYTSSKSLRLFPSPPWLTRAHRLKAAHAGAYRRLLTLICDPSVSSVTRSQHNSLTSATHKAKRMAGQHMQFVLTMYIKLQLEMQMLPEVRECLAPGLHAVFDITGSEQRKMMSDSLDASGRALFGTLYRDYHKFGKWKGL